MKLDYKKTIFVGFAFLIICMFWQVYDTVLARVLVNSFGLNQTWSGVVLAIDNVVALFLIPVFGVISDKTSTKYGRRTPFIVIGTVVAACVFLLVGMFTQLQDNKIKDANIEPVYTCVVESSDYTPKETDELYKTYVLADVDGVYREHDVLVEKKSGDWDIVESFKNIISRTEKETINSEKEFKVGDKVYCFTNGGETKVYGEKVLASDARSFLAQDVRGANIGYFIGFMIILCIVLVAMGSYRSPAVALMPDVTPKPLRSKANAVINLAGSVGGVIALGFLTFLDSDYKPHIWSFVVLSILMIVFLVLFIILVKEPKLVQERIALEKEYGILEEEAESVEDLGKAAKSESGEERMPKDVRKSFGLILASIVLWFFAYNAATSKFSVYATNVLNTSYSVQLIVAQAAAIISYIPIGLISSKLGRKKTIIIGICILFAAFLIGAFLTEKSAALTYAVMALAGIGWATINVNSFPMVVEMCKGADVGRYTGYYYTASMAAQIATPIFSGMMMDMFGMTALFPYCCLFSICALFTMLFVKHGDAKPIPVSNIEALAGAEDD